MNFRNSLKGDLRHPLSNLTNPSVWQRRVFRTWNHWDEAPLQAPHGTESFVILASLFCALELREDLFHGRKSIEAFDRFRRTTDLRLIENIILNRQASFESCSQLLHLSFWSPFGERLVWVLARRLQLHFCEPLTKFPRRQVERISMRRPIAV